MRYIQCMQVSKIYGIHKYTQKLYNRDILMCQEQVHLNNHILTALAQHGYFHNTSNKNELVRITRHEKSLHLAFDTQSLCEISFLQAIHHKTGVRQYIRHLCL